MSASETRVNLCTCNRTMALDAKGVQVALQQSVSVDVATELCRKDVSSFQAALASDRCIVACTQEAPLFAELASDVPGAAELKFVNIRETAGWSAEGHRAAPKIAALLAMAELPDPDPVPTVSYRSGGELLVVGPGDVAVQWAERLKDELEVAVLATNARGAELPAQRSYPIWSGANVKIEGWLGAFDAAWEQSNPIDLDVCTRCNACIAACPEGAIDFAYQIDLDRCKAHRACVQACGSVGAIDFDRVELARRDRFDLVLDLSVEPIVAIPQKPQGYLAPGRDPLQQALAAAALARMVGEFEKPKYFAYDEKICVHGRSAKTGCTHCIDVCSTRAIASDGDKVRIEPHLCMGCGGCATVCPSGALTHRYPRVSDAGMRVKRLLAVYHAAGGRDAAILFHNTTDGREAILKLGRRGATGGKGGGRGLPARVIPVEVFHVASIGIDTMLGALAYGASQVLVLSCGSEAESYAEASAKQMRFAETIVDALGYTGEHLRFLAMDDAASLESALWSLAPARAVAKPATFNLGTEKRTTLEFEIEHLAKHAPSPQREIPLSTGAPYGSVAVDERACTLCMACVGACPQSALLDGGETPRLRFIERNCVQCGLCVNTCPEKALSLEPRLLLAPEVREAVTLHEAEPFHCVTCGKPFGTKQMIDNMVGRLSSHSMWQGPDGLRRLTMCADCRVIDMMENKHEVSILDVK